MIGISNGKTKSASQQVHRFEIHIRVRSGVGGGRGGLGALVLQVGLVAHVLLEGGVAGGALACVVIAAGWGSLLYGVAYLFFGQILDFLHALISFIVAVVLLFLGLALLYGVLGLTTMGTYYIISNITRFFVQTLDMEPESTIGWIWRIFSVWPLGISLFLVIGLFTLAIAVGVFALLQAFIGLLGFDLGSNVLWQLISRDRIEL